MIALACDHTGVALKAEIAKMLDEYDVDEARATADIDRFITKLKEADLLE